MKIGDEVTMLFHFFGMTSEEEWEVVAVDKDTVTLDNNHTFDKTTGECLDDEDAFGARRELKIGK